ncbi:MAG: polysaccharide deacetylase family protein [Clostridia bacterium]
MMKKIIFVYHSIGSKDKFMDVEFEQFKLQINYLKNRKFEFCHFEELLDKKCNSICIMFDDALSSIKQAIEYLEEEKIKYSIGIIENNIGLKIDRNSLKYAEYLFHTSNHKDLNILEQNELLNELTSKLEYINKTIIIYPKGLYNDSVIKFAKEKKYKYGLSVLPFHLPKKIRKFEIPRICINGYLSLNKFKVFTTKAGNLYLHLAFFKRKLLGQSYLKK